MLADWLLPCCWCLLLTPCLFSSTAVPPQLKLLCGADFLETFKIPGMWRDDHVEEVVGRFGLVCVSRGGLQPERAVHESDTLTCYSGNIHLVREWVRNDTSATEVRRALRRGMSVKYLIPDSVIDYIQQHKLYTEDSERRNADGVLRPLTKQTRRPAKSLGDWRRKSADRESNQHLQTSADRDCWEEVGFPKVSRNAAAFPARGQRPQGDSVIQAALCTWLLTRQ